MLDLRVVAVERVVIKQLCLRLDLIRSAANGRRDRNSISLERADASQDFSVAERSINLLRTSVGNSLVNHFGKTLPLAHAVHQEVCRNRNGAAERAAQNK